ncbi:hypothetical protein [Bdellovibrio sp. HCB274]|uniref:hypothetical protein n=1 Tax=Bdellovibrio sp. HCB274 TaxID=3394361 RepID=UPI0039B4FA07
MKTVLVILTMMVSASGFAAANSDKDAKCDSYMAAVSKNAPAQVRLDLGLKAMAAGAMLQLTPAQETKILSNTIKFISKNPGKGDQFEKTFYFVCTTELDGDEVDLVREQLRQLEQL